MPEAWAAAVIFGYLLGSVPVGLWIGRLVSDADLRSGGSGKIGTTNAYRKLGLRWAVVIFLLDVGKGVLPVAVMMIAFDSPTAEVLAGLATAIGHIFPLFAGFRGGRAAACGWGSLLMLTPLAGVVGVGVGLVVLGVTRIMSLSVLLGVAVCLTAQGLFVAVGAEPEAYYGFAVTGWFIVLFAHRDNIARLASGTERVLGRSSGASGGGANAEGDA